MKIQEPNQIETNSTNFHIKPLMISQIYGISQILDARKIQKTSKPYRTPACFSGPSLPK